MHIMILYRVILTLQICNPKVGIDTLILNWHVMDAQSSESYGGKDSWMVSQKNLQYD